jgi:hypothetical protein
MPPSATITNPPRCARYRLLALLDGRGLTSVGLDTLLADVADQGASCASQKS